MTALILSGSYLESNRYLQSEGIRGRHATSATTVQGDYFTRIIELPSFSGRPDRHAVLSAIARRTRGANKVDWTVLEEWSPPLKPELGQEGYKADMLFGDVSTISVEELAEALGHDLLPNDDIQDVSANDDIPESDSTPTPAPAKKAAAKKPAKKVTSSIDDLFGDG